MSGLQGKTFRSALRDIVYIPLFAMAVVVILSVLSCVYSYLNAQTQVVEHNVSSLKVTLNQIEGIMGRIEESFVEYAATDDNHRILKNFSAGTSKEETVMYEGILRSWLDDQANKFDEVLTAFAYYENLDLLQFRGISSFDVQGAVKKELLEGEYANLKKSWNLIKINDEYYLLFVYHSGDFYGGEWLSFSEIRKNLSLSQDTWSGQVFLMGRNGINTCSSEELEDALRQNALEESGKIKEGKDVYYYYTVNGSEEEISMGILIPKESLYLQIPGIIRFLLIGALLSVFLVSTVVLWLRKRIAVPVREVDEAMNIISEGNLDYRLPVTDYNTYNEFDRLSAHFNSMMDELDEAQFKLYETSLREQKTRLTYISQQIRPHFILNALNIIYTYDESEFHLVKKMVVYLTAYFRYIVNLNRDFVETGEELEHTRNYLKIQKERYPDRFDYMVECGIGAEKLLIPPLIIQTFLENSIKYGMKDEGKTFFFVNVTVQGDEAEIFVADSGKGFDEETLQKIKTFQKTREYRDDLGVGIQNTIERLDILYDGAAEIQFANEETGGATILIRLPVKYADDAAGHAES